MVGAATVPSEMSTKIAPAHAPAQSASPRPGRWRYGNIAEILVVSFSALVIEISYTRIISYKLFYYYVYLAIGLALLGIGTGGVLVAISKRLRRRAPTRCSSGA